MEDGATHIISHIDVYLSIFHQESNGVQVASSAGQMNELFAIVVARFKGLLILVQELTKFLHIACANGLDDSGIVTFQCVLVGRGLGLLCLF